MSKRTTTTKTRTFAAAAAPHNSSDSENSDVEEHNHSRTSTSSVEEDVKESNGRTVRTIRTTTTTRTLSGGSSAPSTSTTVTVEQTGFIARVSSIPLVQDSVSTLHSYAKDYKVGRYALDTAESTLTTVNKYTEGYQKSLQPRLEAPLAKVDQLANKSLDLLENTFPIVTKPTAEIVTQVKKPIVFVEESSKNAYNTSLNAYTQLQETIDARVTVPAKTVTNNISTAARTSANNITAAATTRATDIATNINTRATPLVDGLETIVNRYLPEESTTTTETVVQSNQATRVVELTRSVSTRVGRRLSIAPLPQDLRRIAENNAILAKSKESIISLNVRLNALVESLRIHAKELQENVQAAPGEVSSRVQQRLQILSASLLAEIDSLTVYLKEHSPQLPQYVQDRLHPLVVFVNQRAATLKSEYAKTDVSGVQKARNILYLTTEETLPVLQNAAQEIRDTLTQYQVAAQENVQKVVAKVQDINSAVSGAAIRGFETTRVTIIGAK